jgi:hypothetical protein
MQSNGVIHVIDTVMMPRRRTPVGRDRQAAPGSIDGPLRSGHLKEPTAATVTLHEAGRICRNWPSW